MAILATLLIALGLLCRLSVQQDYVQGKNGVFWIFPTEGETFNTVDVVNVSWRAPFTNPKLFTFCVEKGVTKGIKTQLANNPGDGWLLVKLDFTAPEACWFNLRPGDDAPGGSNSPRFGVRNNPRPQLTTIGAVPLSETTSASSSSSSSSSTATTLFTSATTTSPPGAGATPGAPAGAAQGGGGSGTSNTGDGGSDGLSVGAKAGIGIGAAIGAIGLFAVAFCLGRRAGLKRGDGNENNNNNNSASSNPLTQPNELKQTPMMAAQVAAGGHGDSWTPQHGSEYKTPVTAATHYYPQNSQPHHHQHQQYGGSPLTTSTELGTSYNAAELAGQLPHDRAVELQQTTSPDRSVENQKFMPGH